MCYAAHRDSIIYKYYATILNRKYNQFLYEHTLENCPVAYRSNLRGKSNINFAKNAFDFIKKQQSAYIIIGDFKDFFPSLEHKYLKNRICSLLGVDVLEDDYYAVFKNITKYSYVKLEELLKYNELQNNKEGNKKFNNLETAIPIGSLDNLKKNGILHIIKNKDKGIPQGSPISGILANIYMSSFDLKIKELVDSCFGFYMRYSDDIIIVIPGNCDFYEKYNKILNEIKVIPNLLLEDEKKNIFYYVDGELRNITNKYLENKKQSHDILNYLGFSFNGKDIWIRVKTTSKYYYRMRKKAKTIRKNNFITKRLNSIDKKNLYELYSERHEKKKAKGINKNKYGNFINYIKRAENIFPNEQRIANIRKRHMSKIAAQLKCKKLLF